MASPRPDVYVVYRGDDVLGCGTLYQLAERLGMSRDTLKWLASPTCHRRAERSWRRMVAYRYRYEECMGEDEE